MFLKLFFMLMTLCVVVNSCGQKYIKNHKLTVLKEEPISLSRNLDNNGLHNFQIFGQFPSSTSTNIDINILRTIFGIACKYFSNVIQVTSLPPSYTIYPQNGGPCGVTVPSSYIQNGFDQNSIDLTIFIVIESNSAESYVAAASPCIIKRRPLYGYVIFNAAYVTTTPTKPATFHENIYVTMHEMTHILGLNNQYYNLFLVSSSGPATQNISNVVGTINSRQMIITPTVKRYVQTYFGCNDSTIGAILEDQGGAGSAGSHWERTVYLDQMMTASDWPAGLRITGLTLSLLKDTNFYDSVDVTQGQKVNWGSNKGCQFALANANNAPQFCNPVTSPSILCDFYSKYIGYCSNTDPFGDSTYYTQPYSNSVCTYPEYQTSAGAPSASNNYIVFSAQSRCFSSTSGAQILCYQSKCTTSGITIVINGNTGICTTANQTISISGISLICPPDFTAFCGVLTCPNWCNSRGLCLQGQCICVAPWSGIDCSSGCSNLYDTSTGSCVNNCTSRQYVYLNTCVTICPSNYIPNTNRVCIECDLLCQVMYERLMATLVLAILLMLL